MKVIGAGIGRTGTLSLKHALEKLGFGPCYHMVEVGDDPRRVARWQDVLDGKPPAWDAIFAGFQAGVDAPVCFYYKELMQKYPDAKVLLTVRDSAGWYKSLYTTVYALALLPRWMERIPLTGAFLRMLREMVWDGFFQGRFADKAFAIEQFERHNEEVQRHVPADNLLVFTIKEGWEPLCNFLNVPIPDEPFPHRNDRAETNKRVKIVYGIKTFLQGVGIGLIVLAIWLIVTRFG